MINATRATLSQGTFEFFCTKQCKWKWSRPSNSLSTLGCSFWIEKLHFITIYFHFPLFWEILVCVKTPLALLSHPWTPAGSGIPKWLGWAGPLGRALSLHPISQPRPPGWIPSLLKSTCKMPQSLVDVRRSQKEKAGEEAWLPDWGGCLPALSWVHNITKAIGVQPWVHASEVKADMSHRTRMWHWLQNLFLRCWLI